MEFVVLNENEKVVNNISELLLMLDNELKISKYNNLTDFYSSISLFNDYTVFIIDTIIDENNTIEVAGIINKSIYGAEIIYVSTSNKYISDIFMFDPCYYIQKDDINKYLRLAVNKARENIRNKSKIMEIKNHSKSIFINIEEIVYMERNIRKNIIHFENNEQICYKTLEELLKKLPDYFIRCHKSFVVNLNKVNEYNRHTLILQNGFNIPISRTFEKGASQKIKSFLKYQ